MAKQGWLGSIALAIGASAGCAAAQFGLGYGFGVIEWAPAAGQTVTSDKVWLVSLAWTLWIGASSTVVGAICADRRSAGEAGAAPPRREATPTVVATAIWRALLSVSSAIGALLSIALVLTPAQLAGRTDTNAPELIAAGYAVVGITAGIIVAVVALGARAAAVNVIATAVWIWVLAAASLIYDAFNGRTHVSTSIEVWPFGSEHYFRDTWSYEGALVMLSSAVAIALFAAVPAVRRGDNRVGVAISGGAGPALVMAAYLLTIPTLVGVADPQRSASIMAPCALIAGVTGSILVVAAASSRQATLRERAERAERDLAPVLPSTANPEPSADVKAPKSTRPKPTAGVATVLGAADQTTARIPLQASPPGLSRPPSQGKPQAPNKPPSQSKPQGQSKPNGDNKPGPNGNPGSTGTDPKRRKRR